MDLGDGIAVVLEEERHIAGLAEEELHTAAGPVEVDRPETNHMSAEFTHVASFTCHHERSHSLRPVVAAVVAGTGAVGRGCLLVDMGSHLVEGVVGVGAHIAESHMRLAQATGIQHSVAAAAAAEDSRLVAGPMALVPAQDLGRQLLGVTREAWCGVDATGTILR